jgi:hypothetical protein
MGFQHHVVLFAQDRLSLMLRQELTVLYQFGFRLEVMTQVPDYSDNFAANVTRSARLPFIDYIKYRGV